MQASAETPGGASLASSAIHLGSNPFLEVSALCSPAVPARGSESWGFGDGDRAEEVALPPFLPPSLLSLHGPPPSALPLRPAPLYTVFLWRGARPSYPAPSMGSSTTFPSSFAPGKGVPILELDKAGRSRGLSDLWGWASIFTRDSVTP